MGIEVHSVVHVLHVVLRKKQYTFGIFFPLAEYGLLTHQTLTQRPGVV